MHAAVVGEVYRPAAGDRGAAGAGMVGPTGLAFAGEPSIVFALISSDANSSDILLRITTKTQAMAL